MISGIDWLRSWLGICLLHSTARLRSVPAQPPQRIGTRLASVLHVQCGYCDRMERRRSLAPGAPRLRNRQTNLPSVTISSCRGVDPRTVEEGCPVALVE